jgi:hypothetical protein
MFPSKVSQHSSQKLSQLIVCTGSLSRGIPHDLSSKPVAEMNELLDLTLEELHSYIYILA